MQPVIGIDISKGVSEGQVFLDKNKPFGKGFRFSHSKSGFHEFERILTEVITMSNKRPAIIMEATGHYHLPVLDFLESQGYSPIIINPLISQRARKSSLRKVKTDAKDAFHLAELYYKEDFKPTQERNVQIMNLRHLTREHEALTQVYIQHKLNFQSILEQVFPFYSGVFSDLFSETSLRLLQQFPTPQSVREASVESIANQISMINSRPLSWSLLKAQTLKLAAENAPTYGAILESHKLTLNLMIELILQYQEHLCFLEEQINSLAEGIKEYELLRSIPGIGNKVAAVILSEIGQIERFDHPKKLVAFAGIDPSVFSSGNFTATNNKVTKRGSKQLRRALFLGVQCGLRSRGRNQRIREFYDKKRQEGKAYKVALMACMNKLLHLIFALLTKGEKFSIEAIVG